MGDIMRFYYKDIVFSSVTTAFSNNNITVPRVGEYVSTDETKQLKVVKVTYEYRMPNGIRIDVYTEDP